MTKLNIFKDIYQWEVEDVFHRDIRQYNEDGSENPSTLIVPAEVVRVSIVPRIPIKLPRHDVLLDHGKNERFIKRFGRGFEKKKETNLEAILALYKYVYENGETKKVDWSLRDGVVEPVAPYRAGDVRSLNRLVTVDTMMKVMGLTENSHYDDLLNHLRCVDRNKPFDHQSIFYRNQAAKYGLDAPLGNILGLLLMGRKTPFGDFLDALEFPKSETTFEYLHCVQTNHYRLWVWSSSGRALVTNPEYEVYL